MKAASAIGIVIAILAIMGAGIMEGVAPMALLNINALLIVCGGTAGAIFAGVGMKRFMLLPKLYIKAFTTAPPDLADANGVATITVKLKDNGGGSVTIPPDKNGGHVDFVLGAEPHTGAFVMGFIDNTQTIEPVTDSQ